MDPFMLAGGLSAIGSLFQGVTGLIGGLRAAQQEKYNAQGAENAAGVNAQEALQQGDAVAARAATQTAANGGGFVGSSMGVISNLSQTAMFNARAQAWRGRTEAAADIYQAGVIKANAIDSMIGSTIQAGSSLAGGFMRSSLFKQQMAALGQLHGYGADTPYDYMPTGF